MARNALQIGGADSDNPLLSAPWTLPDPSDPTAPMPQGAAVTQTASAVDQWMEAQRQKSAAMGLWNDQTGLPTGKGLLDAIGQTGTAVALGTGAPGEKPPPGFTAYHGSPHLFPPTADNPLGAFDPAKIGTGEGAQAYGVGAGYLAEQEGIARSYRDQLSRTDYKTTTGETVPDWVGNSIARVQDDPNLVKGVINGHLQDFQSRIAEAQAEAQTSHQPWLAQDRIGGLQNIVDGLQKLRSGEATLQPRGHMYEVQVNADPEHFLHWDKPLSEQHPVVQQALKDSGAWDATVGRGSPAQFSGRHAYDALAETLARPPPETGGWTSAPGGPVRYDAQVHNPAAASQALQQAGIPGIRYLDQSSRGAGEGTRNTVVFSPEIMEIIRRYGLAGLMAGGGAAALSGNQQQPQPNPLLQ